MPNEAEKSRDMANKMVIAGDYGEFEKHIDKEDTVTTVLSIEGAHSLGNYVKIQILP